MDLYVFISAHGEHPQKKKQDPGLGHSSWFSLCCLDIQFYGISKKLTGFYFQLAVNYAVSLATEKLNRLACALQIIHLI